MRPYGPEMQQLLDEFQPRAVIGPLLTREIHSLGRLPDEYATPFITPSSTLLNVRQYGSYWFNTAMTSSVQAKRLVEYAVLKLGYHRFCIVYPKTAYGRELADMFAKEVIHSGGEVIAVEEYTEDQTDVAEQLRRREKSRILSNMVLKRKRKPEQARNVSCIRLALMPYFFQDNRFTWP